ncbi:MAG: tyrosine-type recombinase/integrase [Proteobacteria bacterium]|nr:tyrosine-type recombinase/integrase [Pseudomonadota bacterium]
MKSLTTSLHEYIKVRRSLGYQLNAVERNLKKFITYLKKKDCQYITVPLALEWATLPQNVKRSTCSRRLSIVRLFAQYRIAEDPRTEVPPPYLLSQQPNRATPYIYSEKEIRQLLKACQSLLSRGLRHHTYFTFFGLMAVTGCRINELISLNRDDLDTKNNWIIIRNSKGKSRLLPLHPTTMRQLKKYNKTRDQFPVHDINAFFLSDRGTRITACNTRFTFIQLSEQIGLRSILDSYGPRIHDIRHSFAVSALLNWYRKGINVSQKIMLLSTYLGHKRPSDTYWYMTGTAELLAQATARLEKSIGEKK